MFIRIIVFAVAAKIVSSPPHCFINSEENDFMSRRPEAFRPGNQFFSRPQATSAGNKIFLLFSLCLLLLHSVLAQPPKKPPSGNVWDEPKVGAPRPVKKPLLALRWQLLTYDKQNREQAVDPLTQNFVDDDGVRLGVQINQDGYVYIVNHTVERDGKITPPTLISKEQNLIRKDTVIELPTTLPPTCRNMSYRQNGKYWWKMRPPAGREVVTIIFSRKPINELAEAARKDPCKDVWVSDSLLFELTRKAPEPKHEFWTPQMQKQSGLQGIKGAHVIMVWNPNPSNNDLLVERIEFNYPQKMPSIIPQSTSPAIIFSIKEDVFRRTAERFISEGRLTEARQVIDQLKKEEYANFVSSDEKEATSLVTSFDKNSPAQPDRNDLTAEEAEWKKQYAEKDDRVTAIISEQRTLLYKPARTGAEEQRLSELGEGLIKASEAFEKFLDQLGRELGEKGQAKIYQLRESQGLMADLRELGEGSVALYTLVGEEKYRVILITPDFQKAQEYPIKASDLSRKVLTFRQVLQNPNQDPLPLAQELYRILIGPMAKDLKMASAKTLMWSLDGPLRYLPLAALHDGEKYLVENYRSVIFTPASLPRLKDLPSRSWKVLGLGVSKATSGAVALPAVRDELQGIVRQEGTRNTKGLLPGTIKLDEAFTFDSMLLAGGHEYSVVHIASHFQFRPGNEENSSFLLGNGYTINLRQIRAFSQIFSGIDLLTLSACDTAMGSTGADGKEIEGFAVLAQRQGAKSVLATLWQVSDRSTALVMQEFYRFREAHPGTLKAAALQQAQLAMLHGGLKVSVATEASRGVKKVPAGKDAISSNLGLFKPDPNAPFAHPYYWAPFIMIGNWR